MGGGGGGTGPDTPLHGTRSRANTQVRPYAGRGAFRNQRRAVRNKAHGAGRSPPPTGERRRSRRGVVTPPYGCITGGAQQWADVPKAWLPPLRPAGGREGGTPGSSCPTGGCGEPPRLPWVAAHSGASAAQTGGTGGNRGRDHPKSVQQRRTIPQSAFGRQLPLHKGAFEDGRCGLPRRPCGPPRNDKRFLSFRGAERRGNPSFLRWTGVRAAVPRAWPPPTKFRTEIWGVGQVVGPYGRSAEALGIRPYGCSAGGAQQRRVGRVSGISWTPPPPARRSGCCRGSRRGP